MLSIVLTEFQKIKRYHILWIGIIGMLLAPVPYVIEEEELIKVLQTMKEPFSKKH